MWEMTDNPGLTSTTFNVIPNKWSAVVQHYDFVCDSRLDALGGVGDDQLEAAQTAPSELALPTAQYPCPALGGGRPR